MQLVMWTGVKCLYTTAQQVDYLKHQTGVLRREYGYGGFGYSVSNAGDINGDGFSDVIIGAKGDNKAYVYHGSASGLSTTADWTAENNQSLCYFGCSVSTAGDINGDGYSDVIIGAYGYDNDQENEGRAFLYLGSSIGLDQVTSWTAESNQEGASFGIGVSTAGDINGDGYSDVISGAGNYNSVYPNQGRAFFYYGNNGNCIDLNPLQWRHDLFKLIVPPLKSLANDRAKLEMLGKSFFGRTKVKIQFEVRPLGTPFGSGKGEGITETYSWQDIETAGVRIPWYITGLTDRTMYKWRMRIKYDPSDAPPQPYSRWLYNVISPNGPQVSCFQVSDDNNPLPANFLYFISSVDKNNVVLKWSTLSEINNQGYSVQRKIDNKIGRNWVEVGFVRGNGTSNQIHDYQFTDKNLQRGRYEYRLKQVDFNSNHEHHYLGSPVSIGVPAKFELGQNYPNPSNPSSKIDFNLPTDASVTLVVFDITGRLIKTLLNNEFKTADWYTVEFDGSSLASGIYFYRLMTGSEIVTKKMLIIK